MNGPSERMKMARLLLTENPHMTAQQAAGKVGLSPSAISRDASCAAILALRSDMRDAQERAKELVVNQGKSAYEAARLTGLAQSSISRAKWYRLFKESQDAQQLPHR